MERYGSRFVPLGKSPLFALASKAVAMPFSCRVTFAPTFWREYSKLEWNDAPLITSLQTGRSRIRRGETDSGGRRHGASGGGKYLAPEVHSMMNVRRPVMSAADLDRLILLVAEPMEDLKGTYVQKYLRYGERTTFASKKSKAVPVPQRPTCAGREPLV